MKQSIFAWRGVVCLAWAGLFSGAVYGSQNSSTDFSVRLFHALLKPSQRGAPVPVASPGIPMVAPANDNFVFSPYAIRHALGMAATGAKGKTQKQLGRVPEPWVGKKSPSYKLMLASRLWV